MKMRAFDKVFAVILATALAVCGGILFIRSAEITLASGPVTQVLSDGDRTILRLRDDNDQDVKVFTNHSSYSIPKKGNEALYISSWGITTDDGRWFLKWTSGNLRYVPERSFRIFTRRVFLGSVEGRDGKYTKYYLAKP